MGDINKKVKIIEKYVGAITHVLREEDDNDVLLLRLDVTDIDYFLNKTCNEHQSLIEDFLS
jgi:hypothetical protein